jgi:gas vesicle protein
MGEKKGSSLLEGLLLGGMIGAAAGILFAPVAGEESRAKLKTMLQEFGLEGILDRFAEAFEAGKEEMEETMKEEGH